MSTSRVEWLSPLQRLLAADNKLLQVEAAQDLGILFPDTIVASSRKEIEASVGGDIVVKALGHGVINDTATRVLYATRLRSSDLSDEMLAVAPVLVQRFVDASHHWRIVTVGGASWFAELVHHADAIDWREWHPDLRGRWESVDGDDRVRDEALRMAAHFRIGYSSQDWIVSKDGKPYFVDLNPCGRWLFLPTETAEAVTRELAAWLTYLDRS